MSRERVGSVGTGRKVVGAKHGHRSRAPQGSFAYIMLRPFAGMANASSNGRSAGPGLQRGESTVFILLRGNTGQRLRVASGLVLFVFTLLHFLNHAIGLLSLDAMLEVEAVRTTVWRSWPGSLLLGGALVVHVAFALDKIAARKTWRMEAWEALQIVLGLSIPFLLFPHIVNTRYAHAMLGVDDTYLYELARLWPDRGLMQGLLLLMVWVHGCIGMHYWLRLVPAYRRMLPILLIAAVVIPLAGLAGFVSAGRVVAAWAATPSGLAEIKAATSWPNEAGEARLAGLRAIANNGIWLVLLAVAAVWCFRLMQVVAAPKVVVEYVGGPTVTAPLGATLLEISRMHQVPHAAVCGGRSRCSTCRVRIDKGLERQPPPGIAEAVTLGSVGAPPNVRLACQLRPTSNLTISRLLRPSTTGPSAVDTSEADSDGIERVLALMFLDVRNFTQHMEQKLPYDVVYLLNEFFAATGKAITGNGGVIDKYLGDGLLAVFGRRNGPEAGCREALRAARAIDLALDHFNAKLASELGEPMRIGIGIHVGPLLLGRIGWGETVDMTVIGHTVNAASRLEALTKTKGCQLVISRNVAEFAGWTEARTSGESIQVRGVAEPIEIICIAQGRDLPPAILGAG